MMGTAGLMHLCVWLHGGWLALGCTALPVPQARSISRLQGGLYTWGSVNILCRLKGVPRLEFVALYQKVSMSSWRSGGELYS